MSSNYRVSAIVSTYNSEAFIKGCIEDLEAQTISDKIEIIVIDSCSEQNEKDIVLQLQAKYGNILYLRTPQRESIYKSWNRGIQMASGKYLTNANTDDRHRADALERLADTLDAHTNYGVVYADSYITEEKNATFDIATVSGRLAWPDFSRKELFNNCIIGPHPMWRKSLHYAHGLFDENMRSAGDYEFWLRISEKVMFAHIAEPLGLYYWSLNSIEHRNAALSFDESEVARARYWNYPKKQLRVGGSYVVQGGRIEAPAIIKKQEAMPEPLVSVIMPTYNRPEQLREAIRSVSEQTYRSIELIVVNDGGCELYNVVKEFRGKMDINLIPLTANFGTSHARNIGMLSSTGKFIAFLDDDDIYYPNHIETLVNVWDSAPKGTAGVYSDAVQVNLIMGDNGPQERSRSVVWSEDYDQQKLLVSNYIPNLCFMTTRELAVNSGGFDETLEALEDWEFLMHLSTLGAFRHVKKTTCEYRQNWGVKSRNIIPSDVKADLYHTIYSRYAKYANGRTLEQQDYLYKRIAGLEARPFA